MTDPRTPPACEVDRTEPLQEGEWCYLPARYAPEIASLPGRIRSIVDDWAMVDLGRWGHFGLPVAELRPCGPWISWPVYEVNRWRRGPHGSAHRYGCTCDCPAVWRAATVGELLECIAAHTTCPVRPEDLGLPLLDAAGLRQLFRQV